MVECQLPKLDVAGSTPVTRSMSFTCIREERKNPWSDWCRLRLQCSASDQCDEITLGQDADQTSVVDNW